MLNIIIIIINMEKTEAGPRGLYVQEIDVKSQIRNTCSQNTTLNYDTYTTNMTQWLVSVWYYEYYVNSVV